MSNDVLYCAEQIKIPPTFPNILKLYAKAAIRTQPYDLLRWTCAYFRALAANKLPPVKERLEYPPFVHPTGITPGYLRTLLNTFGPVKRICMVVLLEKWQGMSLPETSLYQIFMVGQLLSKRDCNFFKFLAIACGFLGKNLFETLIYVCELLTDEPEGGSAMILLPTFLRLFSYLAKLDCSGVSPCICIAEDNEEISQSCSPSSVSTEIRTGTFRSSLCQFDEQELEEKEPGTDVCRLTTSDSSSSESLTILKDFGTDPRPSEPQDIDLPLEGVQMHPTEPKDRAVSYTELSEPVRSKSEPTVEQREDDDVIPDASALLSDDGPNSFYTDFGHEQGEVSVTTFDEVDDYVPIGLEDILRGICECLEPVREPSREPTPPPPDPFGEFLERMKTEQDEGRLPTVFPVPGIGPPVCTNRVTAVALWLTECARRQEGMVGPRNIRHFLCPDLQDTCVDDVSEY